MVASKRLVLRLKKGSWIPVWSADSVNSFKSVALSDDGDVTLTVNSAGYCVVFGLYKKKTWSSMDRFLTQMKKKYGFEVEDIKKFISLLKSKGVIELK